jgi:hypothetical protein
LRALHGADTFVNAVYEIRVHVTTEETDSGSRREHPRDFEEICSSLKLTP